MSAPSSEALAMKLLATVESLAERDRAPRPGGAIPDFPAPLRVPPTLAALWGWCDGEETQGLFLLAHAVLDGFPHDERALESQVSNMALVSPQNAVRDWDFWPADWLSIGDNGTGDALVIDGEGAVWVWSSEVDTEPVVVHPSFDRWMHELGKAIDEGRFTITRDASQRRVVLDGAWVYDLDDYGWAPVSDEEVERG